MGQLQAAQLGVRQHEVNIITQAAVQSPPFVASDKYAVMNYMITLGYSELRQDSWG